MRHILRKLIAWIQGRCEHNPSRVTFDITEGALQDGLVQWCRDCGAVRVVYNNHSVEWRTVLRYDD